MSYIEAAFQIVWQFPRNWLTRNLRGRSAGSLARSVAATSRNQVSLAKKSCRRCIRLYALDLVSAALGLIIAFLLRYGATELSERADVTFALTLTTALYIALCAAVFPLAGLYVRNWKYGSVSDLFAVFRAVCLTSILLVCMMFFSTRLADVPRTAVLLNAFLLMSFLCASRLIFKIEQFSVSPAARAAFVPLEQRIPLLLVGAGDAADLYLRALSHDHTSAYLPVACLDTSTEQDGTRIRGVPVFGPLDNFRLVIAELEKINQRPRHIVFTDAPAVFGDHASGKLLREADDLGIAVSRLSRLTDLKNAKDQTGFEFRSIELTDLLERPQAALDREIISRMIRGRRVLVTGAGGSIGSELTLQVAACAPAEIILIDNCEYNLYTIDMDLAEKFPDVPRSSYLCSVRRNVRVDEIFDQHLPELVFHAAALKHVPMVELNPCEGVLTNVIGTMNVANAAKRTKVLAMVQISTDKVVNSTSVMGATKRLAELYCQALDIDGFKSGAGPRFMTVRFGNVLGSSGSLIPLFKRQLAHGGPLTVTDPQMTRYFMTIREAVELTLHASAHGFYKNVGQGEIFVLDMGEPIKIIDIARRMIRLAGFTPDDEIAIKIVGCRPGEKLFEELFDNSEQRVDSPIPGVFGAVPNPISLEVLQPTFAWIQSNAELCNEQEVLASMGQLLPPFERRAVKNALASDAEDLEAPAVNIARRFAAAKRMTSVEAPHASRPT